MIKNWKIRKFANKLRIKPFGVTKKILTFQLKIYYMIPIMNKIQLYK